MGLRGCPQHEAWSYQLCLYPRLQGQGPGAAVLHVAPASLSPARVCQEQPAFTEAGPEGAPGAEWTARCLLWLAARCSPAALPVHAANS